MDVKNYIDQLVAGNKFALRAVGDKFPLIQAEFNARFQEVHRLYAARIQNRVSEPFNGANDAAVSYKNAAMNDFGMPIQSFEQMLRIIKTGRALDKAHSSNHRFLDMYKFLSSSVEAHIVAKLSNQDIPSYVPIKFEDIGKPREGVDVSINIKDVFEMVADEFNAYYPNGRLKNVKDMIRLFEFARGEYRGSDHPDIATPYTQLCTLINKGLQDKGIHRFLVY